MQSPWQALCNFLSFRLTRSESTKTVGENVVYSPSKILKTAHAKSKEIAQIH